MVAWRAWIAPALGSAASAPVIILRRVRARLPLSPRVRARLLAGFLAANLVAVLLTLVDALGWGWLIAGDWLAHLNASVERGTMDRYSGVLFGVVAALAAAQALLPPPPRTGPRWLWTLGWLSAALFIALVAFEELHRQVDAGAFVAPALGLMDLPPNIRWVLVAAPLAVLPAAAAGWALFAAQRGHPARVLLSVLAVALAATALIYDAVGDLLVNTLGFPAAGPEPIYDVFEEGAELMAAGSLAVVLIEMLASRSGPVRDIRPRHVGGRRWVALTVVVALLAVSGFALSTRHVFEDDRWVQTWVHGVGERPELRQLAFENDKQVRVRPWSYTGPVSLIEQRFRADHDNLTRIDVWAEIDGGASAEIFARLTPEGSDRPVRESRAEVRGARFSNATAAFRFAPIPDSGGATYTLAVGVLSGPKPYVFLGLTDSALNPTGDAVISGAPSRHREDLAMRTSWTGRLAQGMLAQDTRRLALIGEMILVIFVWVLLVVVAGTGLSGRRPRFWRRFVWRSVLTSALITAGILVITLAFFAVLSPTRLA